MSDRVPIGTIPGLVSDLVGQDVLVATLGVPTTVSRVWLARMDQLAPDVVVAQLRTAAGGGGSGLTVTFAAGAESAVATGTLAVAAGESLYLRVTAADANSLHLRGWFEVTRAAGVTTALTNLARVKAWRGISSSDHDALLEQIIAAVSARMQRYMGRRIVLETRTGELYDGPRGDTLQLAAFPISDPGTVEVRLNGEIVDPATYAVLEAPGQIVAVEDGVAGAWERGRLNYAVDYEAGFDEVPEDLAEAATRQVAYRSLETPAGNTARLGNRGTVLAEGGSAEYLQTEWAPGVLATLDAYRERRLA